jgi:hypothetical protein
VDSSTLVQVYPPLEFIDEIYENTLALNKMRAVLVDMWAYNKGTMDRCMSGPEDEYHKSFLFDLAKRQGYLSHCIPRSYAWSPDFVCSAENHEHEDVDESRTTAVPVRTENTEI